MSTWQWIAIAVLALALRKRIEWLLFFSIGISSGLLGMAAGAVASVFFAIVPRKPVRS
jgi:hypothetical protein